MHSSKRPVGGMLSLVMIEDRIHERRGTFPSRVNMHSCEMALKEGKHGKGEGITMILTQCVTGTQFCGSGPLPYFIVHHGASSRGTDAHTLDLLAIALQIFLEPDVICWKTRYREANICLRRVDKRCQLWHFHKHTHHQNTWLARALPVSRNQMYCLTVCILFLRGHLLHLQHEMVSHHVSEQTNQHYCLTCGRKHADYVCLKVIRWCYIHRLCLWHLLFSLNWPSPTGVYGKYWQNLPFWKRHTHTCSRQTTLSITKWLGDCFLVFF